MAIESASWCDKVLKPSILSYSSTDSLFRSSILVIGYIFAQVNTHKTWVRSQYLEYVSFKAAVFFLCFQAAAAVAAIAFTAYNVYRGLSASLNSL